MWSTITTNVENTSTESWLILLLMFVAWAVFCVVVIFDQVKHPDKYKNQPPWTPPH